jgi:potassium large conductance calcium-activated channel subfamily M alpha protein 1
MKSEINSLKNSERVISNSNKNNQIKAQVNKVTKYKKQDQNKIPKDNHNKDSMQLSKEENIEQHEENDINCRQRLTRFLELHDRLFYIKLIIYILSFISFFYYVACTYVNSLFPSLNYIDFLICTIYIFEHLINIILAHHFFFYIISMESLILFLLEIPPFFSLLCSDFHLNSFYRFINITRVLRLLKASNIVDLFLGGEKNVNSQVINIISTLISIVLVWGGVIHQLDLGYVETNLKITFDTLPQRNLLLRRHFHHYIYFIVVSLTTVGYGEIVPQTVLAQWMIIFLAVVILVVIPDKTSELINLSNAQTVYERNKYISSPDVPYVVVIGDVELDPFKNFCKEYFHKDHGDGYRHIVILVNKPPNKSMEYFLNQKDNTKFITYLQGDAMDSSDLLRADILNAKSCIIFTNKNSLDPYSGDHQSLLLATFIKKFFYHRTLENYFDNNKEEENFLTKTSLKKKINTIFKKNKNIFRICLQLNRPESTNYYYSTLQVKYHKRMLPDKLLVIEHIKMNLLSKSCLTPGIISLISNLVISSTAENTLSKNEPEWIKEYTEGQQYEIYKYNSIEGDLLFYSFQELTQEIYNRFHGILIALEISYHGGNLVKLNPQKKETLIDIVFPSLISKTKNTSAIERFENIDEQEHDSLLDGSEDELEEVNLRKIKNNINLKNIKINLYCISSDKNIIDEIKKLDEGKKKNLIKKSFTRQSSNNDKISRSLSSKKIMTSKRVISKSTFQNISDSDSESSDDNVGDDSIKYLVDTGNNQRFEEDDLSNNYYTLENTEKNYLYSNEIMRQGIKDRYDIKNHIIICGMHQELIHFILPLRNKYLPEKLLKWIVILAPSLPQEIHDSLSKFPKVIFIQGDPLYPDNLFRANVTSADIAVILSSVSSIGNSDKEAEINEIIGKENDDSNAGKDGGDNNNTSKIDDEMIDSKALFIYKSIKKLNHSIQIITELLRTNDIEFLLTSRNLKKLYKDSFRAIKKLESSQSSQSQIYDDNESSGENLHYEHTPVYAAGEVYLPSVVDKITGQMFYNSNLLTILNLLLIGEKPPEKKADKKLAQMFDLQGTNLFLIPCEPRNESFSDMFKRLLSKYSMISVALYRKNEQEDFYYVYTNPKKTTLIRETDMVFVLSSTENIIAIYEKNLVDVHMQQKMFDGFFGEEKNENDIINDNDNKQPFINALQDAVQNQLKESGNNKKKDKDKNVDNINLKNALFQNLFKDRKGTFKKGEDKDIFIQKGKYTEIDNMQNKLDKAMEKLKSINLKSKNIEKDVNNFVQEEISNELSVYITKTVKKN